MHSSFMGLSQNRNFSQTQAAPKASPVQGEVARRAGGVQAADACSDPSVSLTADSSPYAGEPRCGHLLCMLRILRQALYHMKE